MTKKQQTNEQVLKKLLKELHTMEIAILRERILMICDISIKSIEKDPNGWYNPIVSVTQYQATFKKIKSIVDFK